MITDTKFRSKKQRITEFKFPHVSQINNIVATFYTHKITLVVKNRKIQIKHDYFGE